MNSGKSNLGKVSAFNDDDDENHEVEMEENNNPSPTAGTAKVNVGSADQPQERGSPAFDDSEEDEAGVPLAATCTNELVVIVGKHYPTSPLAKLCVRFPMICLLISAAVFITTNFLFLTTDAITTVGTQGLFEGSGPDSLLFRKAAFAVDEWSHAQRQLSSFGSDAPSEAARDIFVTYRSLQPGQPIMSLPMLQAIGRFERNELSKIPAYRAACWFSPNRGSGFSGFGLAGYECTPLNSVMQYFYPGEFLVNAVTNQKGWEFANSADTPRPQVPLKSMIDVIRRNSNWQYYLHSTSSNDPTAVDVIRTTIHLRGTEHKMDRAQVAIATMLEIEASLSDETQIEISYGGSNYYESRISRIIRNDILIGTSFLLVVFVPLVLHFHSKLLAWMAVIMLMCIYPTGVYFYCAFTGDTAISLLNVLSYLAVLVGAIQAQTVFFTTFVHSGTMATTGTRNTLSVAQRLSYTFRSAGLGITAAAVVSVACFAAIAQVPIPAVQQFGSILVSLTVTLWVMMFTLFPSIVLTHHFYISGSRRNAQKKKEFLVSKRMRDRNKSTARFFKDVAKLKLQYWCAQQEQTIQPAERLAAFMPECAVALQPFGVLRSSMLAKLEEDMLVFDAARRVAPSVQHMQGMQAMQVILRRGLSTNVRNLVGKWRDSAPTAAASGDAAVHFPGEEFQHDVLDEFDAAVTAGDGGRLTAVHPLPLPEQTFLVGHVSADHFDGPRVEQARQWLFDARVTSVFDMKTDPVAMVGKYFGVLPSAASNLRQGTARAAGGREHQQHPGGPSPLVVNNHALMRKYTAPYIPSAAPRVTASSCGGAQSLSTPSSPAAVSAVSSPLCGAPDARTTALLLSQEMFLQDIYSTDVSPTRGDGRGDGEDATASDAGSPTAGSAAADRQRMLLRSSRAGTLVKQLMYSMFGVAACIGPRRPVRPVLPPPPQSSQRPPADGDAPPPPPAPPGPPKGAFVRWMNDATGRDRAYLLFGKRNNETAAQRKTRILALPDPDGGGGGDFNIVERFLYQRYAPLAFRLRLPSLVVFLILLVLCSIATSRLTVSIKPLYFLPTTDAIGRYQREAVNFASGRCPLCSPYFAAMSVFSDYTASTACQQQLGMTLMLPETDLCGVCLGNSSTCASCSQKPQEVNVRPPSTLDQCGQCLHPTDPDYDSCVKTCQPYEKTPSCTDCQTRTALGFPVGVVGPSCNLICLPNSVYCPAERGICNTVTGQCQCFQDPVRGFFGGHSCSQCYDDSLEAPACLFPKDRNAVTCAGFLPGSCWLPDPSVCNVKYGTLMPPTSSTGATTCDCKATEKGGKNCALDLACSMRGHQDPVSGRCFCAGMFFGTTCQFCGCRNGGTCHGDGTCRCMGSWEGEACTACSPVVVRNLGRCPLSWLPEQYYTTSQCRLAFCSLADLENDNASDEMCGRCARADTVMLATANIDAWCPGTRLPASQCSMCDGMAAGSTGVTCDLQGVLIGCDGQRGDTYSRVKKFNRCGVCGGSNLSLCIGCNGKLYSPFQINACGVCAFVNMTARAGGQRDPAASCTADTSSASQISFFFGLTDHDGFDALDVSTQMAMAAVARRFLARGSRTADLAASSFFYIDYVAWLPTVNITFPVESRSDALTTLMTFAYETGRENDLGLKTARDAHGTSYVLATPTTVTFIRSVISTRKVADDMSMAELKRWRAEFDGLLADAVAGTAINPALHAALGNGKYVVLTSQAWVNLESQVAITRGITQAVVIGFFLFAACTLASTRSVRLSLLGILIFVSNVLTVLALYYVLAWGVGQIELITVGIVLGSASGQIVHFVESYRESLHRAQSHLLGTKMSPLKGLQATFQRHGCAYAVSYMTILVSTCIFYACTLTVLHRVATTVILTVLVNLIHVLFFLPALLGVFAPSQISIRKSRKIGFAAGGVLVLIVGAVVVSLAVTV